MARWYHAAFVWQEKELINGDNDDKKFEDSSAICPAFSDK